MKRRKKKHERQTNRRRRRLAVEPLEGRCLLAADFGDAPAPYPVLLVDSGASHTTSGALQLGSAVDSEADGTPSAAANFDDLNGTTPDDEDGVTFGTMMVGALGATVTVNVQGAVGKLDAWIDFNGDGSWGGPGEQIFDSRDLVVGANVLTFDVSNFAQADATYARFRLSTAGTLGMEGAAADGEVEDYQVTIANPAAASGVFGGQNTISTAANGAYSVYAADVDGDGDLDALSASRNDDKIAWYENDGSQNFTPHTISTAADGAVSVLVADVDGDGDLDVLSASVADDKIAWYENDGSQTFTPHTISTAADGAYSVFSADVDGDGDLDVLSASVYDDKIAWYENDGSQTFTPHTISTVADGAFGVFAADVDGDGDLDVLSASVNDDKIAWYENDGSQTFTPHTISTAADGAASVFAADVDGDGDMDVFSASVNDDKIAWYENDGSQTFTPHTISTAADSARSVFAADVDSDGDLDVLSASQGDSKIAWYENDGSQNFTAQTISTAANGAFSVFAADVDGDGDLDVLSASQGDSKIAWYEQQDPIPADFGDAPAPYPVLLVDSGASHATGGALQLGSSVDSEADGTHSAAANFDDLNGTTPDDEDGVSFGTMMVGALGAAVTVNVQGAAGKLDAWIDFNGDGSWGGPGEQIFASRNVVVGDNNLTFDVPSYAIAGTTYARFRLSTAGGLGTEGAASDGEVEDYQVTVANPAAASGLFDPPSTISTAANGAQSVFAADVDGDGDLDVLSASRYDNKIAWYENDGNQNFTAHSISTAANGAYSVFAADVDGDGDLDVLSASVNDDKIAWYENDGSQNFTPHTISTAADSARSVFAADVDGDGDLDVLSASRNDDKIAWYENDGSQIFTPHTISTAANGPYSVFAADVDGDGDLDVLSASVYDDKIAWYENDGSQNFTPHTINTAANAAVSVFAADVDGDGDLDVLSASFFDDSIAWYENDGSQNFTRHTISTMADGARSVFAADVDGDGDLDVLSASSLDDKIAWYENDGSQNFTPHTISTAANGAQRVFAADVDGDGDLDVLSASVYDDKIAWYEQLRFDSGDAPVPYPTTIAENGAQHTDIGLTLGATRDGDLDGTHSAGATADGADEDGVTFGTLMVGALGATVTVNVQGAVGKLDAWIDFNGDGSWGGLGEQIFASQNVVIGNNNLTFDVPSYAIGGTTYARFRLSTAGALGTEGLAADGEVEDYQVTIANPAAATGVFGGQNTISTAADGARSVFAADVDGDGDLDLLSASSNDAKIAWYENDGSQTFTPHTISTAALGAISVVAADVDGDGDLDVLSASVNDDKIAWYENDGSQTFTPHTISTAANGASSVFAADVDGDGDTDVLSASVYDDKIAWYENDGSQTFTPHTISTATDGAYSVFAADVDVDGDLDVLSASRNDDKIAWYENDGSQTFAPHTISTFADGAVSVFAADVDGDGDLDVLSASVNDDKIAWYENDGSQTFTPHTISTAADSAQSVFAADVDGDGDLDVLSASANDAKIAWYENDGIQNFTPHTISTAADSAQSVFAADVDGDGDLDVLSASRNDDKIAWYENLESDYGDAPAPYPTTLAENGARHAVTGPTLGANRDPDADGTHSAAADFDDLNGATPDDEDGVTFGTMMVGALGATVTVNVQGAVGKLDAWIDFNGDGAWGGPGEQIFASQNVAVGNNNLTFDVPSYAIAGTTYARFRLSTAGALGPEGLATDGEVEDFQVTIANPAVASGVFGGQNIVTTAADGAFSVYAADVDGDGDLDLLSASRYDDEIAWYENDGSQNFTPHTISTEADQPRNVFAADVDGDGDLDVLSASEADDEIAWYENDGNQNFTPHTISTAADSPQSMFAADVDGDGDLDVLSASANDDKIAWYENDGSQNFTPHTISTAAVDPISVFAADVDGDGDLDVLNAAFTGDEIAWYENDGSQTFTPHTISTAADGAFSVFAADVDADGDLDVLSASANDNKIAWYENDGSQNFTAHTISTAANTARSVFAADVDGDGDLDVFSASQSDNKIAWYENDGSQNFTAHTISTAAIGAFSVTAADVDGDGDLDVLSASRDDDKIAWYENFDEVDFGDAPIPYPTTLTENGALHQTTGPALGTNRDSEADGVHSATANTDDITGSPDDEDGVTFGTLLVGALGPTVTVNVQGAVGKLDAWIDFNGDGAWGGPGEQIFASQNVVIGNNNLTFDVPSYAIAGTTYARFRLSTAGALGTEGVAADGEVEDYQVTIANPAAASGIFGGQNTVTTAADGAFSVYAADVDGDGDLDLLSASRYDDEIAWYENDGSQNFTPHTISTEADQPRNVFAADVDGDGDLDVLSASEADDEIAWYENDGNQNFTPHTISTAADSPQSMFAADVDGDGDLDVLSASANDDKIAWYENDGSQNFTPHTISTAAVDPISVFAADVDADGDLDVLNAAFTGDQIAWYENDGSENFTPHTISTAADGAFSVFAADVDADGDLDVLSASANDNKIAWYENDGSQNFTAHTISAAANTARSVFAADVDGDGDLDVLSASQSDNKIAWYENDGSQNFTAHTISTAAIGAFSVTAADVDGDGDLDVLSASRDDDKIAWYENLDSDYGDAPAPYPTTDAENGARHKAIGPTLGANRDLDADGTHSAAADFDDLNGTAPDDEDGVTITSLLIPGSLTTVTVNSSGVGKLDAWVDFDDDGSWAHPGEQVFAGQLLSAGNNLLSFLVPAGATLGAQTFARFRVSTAGGLTPTGSAADGEVEDHAVEICGTMVTHTGDSGLGSLRVAIQCANGATGAQTITFNIPGAGPHVILPATALPTITNPVVIDGTSEPDFAGTPVVEIDGINAGVATTIDGLKISAGNSTVKGLAINRFGGDGIEITTLGGNTIQGNYVGIGTNGTTDKGNGQSGVRVTNTAGNTIGGAVAADGNVISGNATHGVFLFQGGASNNVVQNNRVGTNAAGTAGVGNSSNGVYIVDGPDNQVLDNTIAGNLDNGLVIENGAGAGTASGAIARGNEIGTNSAGTATVANTGIGLFVINAPTTTIGGAAAGQGNLVSGNGRSGIVIQGSPATGAVILGNTVGLAANGNTDLGNASYGVWLLGAPGATVGGAGVGESNIISGNNRNGVVVSGSTAAGNVIRNNLIGTDVTGLIGRGNSNVGVWLDNSPGATVESNVIASNGKQGVLLSGLTASGNVVRDNLIGTAINGTSPLGNTSFGVWLLDAPNNTIGGVNAGDRNVIAKSGTSGLVVTGVNAFGNVIQGNSIGTDAGGTLNLGNTQRGIQLLTNAHDNTIGGTTAGAGNTIAFNGGAGVWALLDAGVGNAVLGNSTFSNTGVGIDLGPGGATANDASDPDTGPNLRQNTPVMTVATRLANGDLQITFSVDSLVANAAYPLRVEFFLADVDNQEGLTFLGFHNYAAPGAVTTTFTPAIAIAAGQRLVATATDNNDNTSEFSANIVVASALRAAGGNQGSDGSYGNDDVCRELSSADLAPTIDAAIVLLAEQGISSDQLAALASVEFAIADLPDDLLGLTTDTTITIDQTAAGYAWFIDPTPLANEEYSQTNNSTLLAAGDSAASGHMDLLTAVLHELSHLLGHDHTTDADPEELMYAELATGLRKLP